MRHLTLLIDAAILGLIWAAAALSAIALVVALLRWARALSLHLAAQ